ncbi:hypothetical protein B0J11DRAFT_216540 [Dendryphion nanum]|uniref:F-box domain-containing protein n=1 Tax=Dendryphion nanum TaxID=256645 RepID=A0A9P9IV15_9PLEO|nr:hypothetical protein B0J11DRAFT_216540 [Dendryphion nanum]
MYSAVEHVFDTPELLEIILARLPQRDLLLAQQISKQFQAAIVSSPTLQQSLFFRPTPFKDPSIWTINPLLRKTFPPWFITYTNNELPGFEVFPTLDFNKSRRTKEAFLHPDASWRKMFLIQPPPPTLSIQSKSMAQFAMGVSTQWATIFFEKRKYQGVTMDALYDITLESMAGLMSSIFFLSFIECEASSPAMTLHLYSSIGCGLDGWLEYTDLRSRALERFDVIHYDKERTEWIDIEDLDGDPTGDWYSDIANHEGGYSPSEYNRWVEERKALTGKEIRCREEASQTSQDMC